MNSLRLATLALAALASVATSAIEEPSLAVIEAFPADGARNVSPDVQPRVSFALPGDDLDGPDPDWLSLRTADGAPVAGQVVVDGSGNSLVFLPGAPLPLGEYVLQVAVQDGMELHTDDAVYLGSGIGVRFRVSAADVPPPVVTVLGSTFVAGDTTGQLAFTAPVQTESLRSRLAFTDAAGAPVVVLGLYLTATNGYEFDLEGPAATMTIADGVLAVDGQPVEGLPVSF